MNILEKILNGDKITEKINIKGRGEFEILFPLPSNLRNIEVKVAGMLNGQSIDQFTPIVLANFRCHATLDEVIIHAPDWFEKLDSIEDCPDQELLTQLYRGYLQLYKKTQVIIGKSKLTRKDKESKSKDKDETLDDGPFQDIAHGSEDEGSK